MRQKMNEKGKIHKHRDLFRETNIRYIGYSHEIAEAFGSMLLIPCKFTHLSYGLTASYILAAVGAKAAQEHQRQGSEVTDVMKVIKKACLWQLFASLIIPRMVINGISEVTCIFMRNNSNIRWRMVNICASLVVLGCIPVIVKPIDELVDKILHDPNDIKEKKPIKRKSQMKDETEKGVDIYRDTYLRYLGYTNEIGEAFRHLWPRHLVHLTYGVAVTYVLADASDKGLKANAVPGETKADVIFKAGDVLVWQMLASVIIPGFTINRIATGTGVLVKRFKIPNAKYLPTVVGLASIPMIIHPIDKMVDYLMDNTYRKYFK